MLLGIIEIKYFLIIESAFNRLMKIEQNTCHKWFIFKLYKYRHEPWKNSMIKKQAIKTDKKFKPIFLKACIGNSLHIIFHQRNVE